MRGCLKETTTIMTIEDNLEQAASTIRQGGRDLYGRALERTKEGAEAADKILRRNTYNVLLAGLATGFLVGYVCARACRRG